MKKLLLSLFVLVLVPMAGFGQTYSFSGTVTGNGGPVPNSTVCVITWYNDVDTLGCTATDDAGFFSFEDLAITSNDSIYLVSEHCGTFWQEIAMNQLEGAVIDIDCGNAQLYDLYIGTFPVDITTSSWYFVSSLNEDVASYDWTVEGQSYSTATVLNAFSTSGFHQIDLTVVLTSGESYSANTAIYVNNPADNCNAHFFQYGDSVVDGTMYFAQNSLGSNLSYFWDFGDGNTSDEAYPIHTFAEEIVYTVCLTITGDEECEETYCLEVDPGDDGSGLIPNGNDEVEASGNSKSSGFDFVVVPVYSGPLNAENADMDFEMSLFPNPSTGNVNFRLDLPVADNGAINVTDVTGKVVFQKSVSVGAGAIINMNFNQLPAGIYLVQYQGKMNSKVLKMAIQR